MLNHKFFDSSQDNQTFLLGDRCHQQQKGAVPVWVVTDLTGQIIIGNKATAQSEWVVTGGRITINRMFQASTAMLVLGVEQIDFDKPYPELPSNVARSVKDESVAQLAEGQSRRAIWKTASEDPKLNYSLDKNDEIAIWCGYIEGIREVTQKDLEANKLIRRFVGVIDTLTCSGTPTQGVTMIIQCRDRLKYLMDSIGTFNTADFDPLKPGSASSWDLATANPGDDPTTGREVTISRADVIIEIARRCIGHLGGSRSLKNLAGVCDSVCGSRIHFGFVSQYTQDTEPSADFQNMYDLTNINNSYIGYRLQPTSAVSVLPVEGTPPAEGTTPVIPAPPPVPGVTDKNKYVPFIGGKTRIPREDMVLQPDLTFNIVTGRLPYRVKGMEASAIGSAQGITDRVPAEFIKFLSFQEPWPTEFFCDSRSGEYWYAPRGLDISGLVDPKRFYRTYFFRNAPDGAIDHIKETSAQFVEKYNVQKVESEVKVAAASASDTSLVTVKLGDKTYKINPKRVIDRFTDLGSRLSNFLDFLPLVNDDTTTEENSFIEAFENFDSVNGSDGRGDRVKRFITNNTVAPGTLPNDQDAGTTTPTVPRELIKQPTRDFGNAIHSAQAALLYREESSSINWRSNIIVINQPTNDVSVQNAVHLKLNPPWLANRNYACSYFQATDTTIGNNKAELVSVAMAYARIFSKELKAATLHITGDPSIVPGEAVQVIGSPMHPEVLGNEAATRGTWKWDRQAVVDYVAAYRDLYTDRLEAHKTDDVTAKADRDAAHGETTTGESNVIPGFNTSAATPTPPAATTPQDVLGDMPGTFRKVQVIEKIDRLAQAQLMCPAVYGQESAPVEADGAAVSNDQTRGGNVQTESQQAQTDAAAAAQGAKNRDLNTINFPEDPKSIWRVEAVIDKFNEDQSGSGYRTELALLAPF